MADLEAFKAKALPRKADWSLLARDSFNIHVRDEESHTGQKAARFEIHYALVLTMILRVCIKMSSH